jgi:hypothetical protein
LLLNTAGVLSGVPNGSACQGLVVPGRGRISSNLKGCVDAIGKARALTTNNDTFMVQVQDSSKTPLTATATLTLPENSDPLVITSGTLPGGSESTPYSTTLAATGGTGTVSWALAPGSTLVAGLTLSAAGVLSGTPTASTNGVAIAQVTATDSASPVHTASASINYVIKGGTAPVFKITTTSLEAGVVGSAYSATLATSGGTSPISFALIDSTKLPAGLTLSKTGAISGTPTTTTTGDTFTVQATDSSKTPQTAKVTLKLVVNANPISVTPLALPEGYVSSAYTVTLTAKGGTSPYTWALATGSVAPVGLKLSTTGILSGTPSVAKAYSFSVKVTDSAKKTNTVTLSLVVGAALTINSSALPEATVGTPYTTTLSASGGKTPFVWSIAAGSKVPAGLALSSAGVLSGKPTTSGQVSFIVELKDAESTPKIVTGTLTLQINPATPLAVTSLFLPPAYLDTAFSTQLTASGGIAPYKWTLKSGSSLPKGLTLASTGVISGKATVESTLETFDVTVTDSSTPVKTSTASISAYVYAPIAKCTGSTTGNALLKGRYSFELQTVVLGSAQQQWMVGAFTADGAGHLTAGIFDVNGPNLAAEAEGTLTGTYAIGSSATNGQTGTFTLNLPTGVRTFCAALDSVSAGVAAGGHLVEDDQTGLNAAGQLYLQPAKPLTLAELEGGWAFGLEGGQIPSGGGLETRHTVAGYLDLNVAGILTSGEYDADDTGYNDAGDLINEYRPQNAITGRITLASTGRGTMAVKNASGTANYVFYATANNTLLVISSDPGNPPTGDNNPVFVGKVIKRTVSTFTSETLSKTSVFVLRSTAVNNSLPVGREVQLGIFDWNGKGGFTGFVDTNHAGTVTTAADDSFAGDYVVDTEGRVTLTAAKGSTFPTLYLVGDGQGFGLGAGVGAALSEVMPQTAPAGGFTLSSIKGAYSLGTVGYSFEHEPVKAGEITSNGTDGLGGSLSENLAGDVTLVKFTGKYSAATNGRFTVTFEGETKPSTAYYVVSPTEFYSINLSGDVWEPILQQTHQ